MAILVIFIVLAMQARRLIMILRKITRIVIEQVVTLGVTMMIRR